MQFRSVLILETIPLSVHTDSVGDTDPGLFTRSGQNFQIRIRNRPPLKSYIDFKFSPNYLSALKKAFVQSYRPTTSIVRGEIMFVFTSYCQCCRSENFYYGSGSNFSMSFESGSDFQKVPDPNLNPTFFLKKYDFKGPKKAF
jgi:hypothetical protein